MILQNIFRARLSLACMAVAGLALALTANAQDVLKPENVPGRGAKKVQVPLNVTIDRSAGFDGATPAGLAQASKPQSQAVKLRRASELLKQAEGAEARKEALAILSTVVNEIFDEDLTRRESEVNNIRKRVQRLKALIDKRKESKDRIVDLQFRIQVNEATGLGFSVKQDNRNRGNPYLGAGVPGMSSAMEPMTGGSGRAFSGFGYGGGEGGFGAGADSEEPDDPRSKAEQTLQAVMAKLKSSKKDEDRQSSIKALKPALEAYFAADLKVREQEIADIQSRVDNLDKLIERRRNARDEIISLQLEVLTNEADGLGFFSTGTRGSSQFRQGISGAMTGEASGAGSFGIAR